MFGLPCVRPTQDPFQTVSDFVRICHFFEHIKGAGTEELLVAIAVAVAVAAELRARAVLPRVRWGQQQPGKAALAPARPQLTRSSPAPATRLKPPRALSAARGPALLVPAALVLQPGVSMAATADYGEATKRKRRKRGYLMAGWARRERSARG